MIDWRGALRSAGRPSAGEHRFRCNICATTNVVPLAALQRETRSCWRCGSNLRYRGLVHALSVRLFGRSLGLPEWPLDGRAGIGFSDDRCYANRLARRGGYLNTWYHKPPQVDIARPGTSYAGRFDYALCSDVLEHVPPPVEAGFAGLHAVLRPGGIAVITVPYLTEGRTVEHYPSLHDFQVRREADGAYVVVNRTASGAVERFADPVFHGGPGQTLEMRVFTEADVLAQLARAGFVDIHVHREDEPRFGIIQREPWSLPISARKPA